MSEDNRVLKCDISCPFFMIHQSGNVVHTACRLEAKSLFYFCWKIFHYESNKPCHMEKERREKMHDLMEL
jgi:hypothetical protein